MQERLRASGDGTRGAHEAPTDGHDADREFARKSTWPQPLRPSFAAAGPAGCRVAAGPRAPDGSMGRR